MINPKYLKSEEIQRIFTESRGCNPVQFLVFEDFIDPKIYAEVEKEILSQEYKKVDFHSDEHRKNKTVILQGEKLAELFKFFESQILEKYLGLYIGKPVKQEFYVDYNQVSEALGEKFEGAVAQIYEKGDFFDWHIDGPMEQGSQGAFTYYLGGYEGDWDVENGGNLEFGMEEEPGSESLRSYYTLPYKKNTLVFIYASSIAYHRVTPVLKDIPRLSIQSTLFRK